MIHPLKVWRFERQGYQAPVDDPLCESESLPLVELGIEMAMYDEVSLPLIYRRAFEHCADFGGDLSRKSIGYLVLEELASLREIASLPSVVVRAVVGGDKGRKKLVHRRLKGAPMYSDGRDERVVNYRKQRRHVVVTTAHQIWIKTGHIEIDTPGSAYCPFNASRVTFV